MTKIIIYTTPSCPYSQQLKEFLKERGAEYEEINVAEDKAKAKEMIELTDQMSVPVFKMGETIVVGFDKEAVDKALEGEKDGK